MSYLKLDLYFTEQEQIDFLKDRDFVITKEKREIAYDFREDVEIIEAEVYCVYKDGKPHEPTMPIDFAYRPHAWLERTFEQEMKKSLLSFKTNIKFKK